MLLTPQSPESCAQSEWMMSWQVPAVESYLEAPGRAAPTSWWKAQRPIPPGVRLIHARDDESREPAQRFFKLTHDLRSINPVGLVPGLLLVDVGSDAWTRPVLETIARAYEPPMDVTIEEIASWRRTPVHDPSLWVGVVDQSGRLVGSAISDYDPTVGEGSIEWVQVIPSQRGRGVGKALVTATLSRLAGRASFVTVAGDADDPTRPELLYRACGFRGEDIWHVHRSSLP